jgi:RNA polymerase sigma-70 factor (ECF subfamily)
MRQDDSEAAAAEIADRFFGRIALFAARRLGDRAAGEDIAQETLSRVLAALRAGGVESPESLPAFVFQTARNLCMHHARSRGREARAIERLKGSAGASSHPPAEETWISAERAARVRAALDRLREADREILREAFENWHDTDEIASRLGLSAEAVRVRKHRALARLGDLLRGAGFGNAARGSGTQR